MNLWKEPRSVVGALFFFATIIPRLIIHAIIVASKVRR